MIRRLFCKWFHGSASVAFAGIGCVYHCRRCLCEWPVPWATESKAEER